MAADSALSAVLRRDRLVSVLALAVLVALAWLYLVWTQAQTTPAPMPGMADMPGMEMMTPAPAPWTATQFVLVFLMWAIMMVAMMLPSAAPMVLTYVAVARQAQTTPFASAAWFVAGYLIAWAAFSLVATLAQHGLQQALLLTPMLALESRRLVGGLLILAGVYQWTPLKNACLAQCRAPLAFVQNHGGFQPQALRSLRLGLLHGVYCIGCCWLVMLLLFAGGVMNLVWVAVLAVVVLGEKVVPGNLILSRGLGAIAMAGGAWFLLV